MPEILKGFLLLGVVGNLGVAFYFEWLGELDKARNCLLWAIALLVMALY